MEWDKEKNCYVQSFNLRCYLHIISFAIAIYFSSFHQAQKKLTKCATLQRLLNE